MSATVEIRGDGKHFEGTLDAMRAKVSHFGEHLTGLGTKIAAGFGAERLLEKAFDVIREGIHDIKEFKESLEDVQASLGASADEAQRFAYAVKRADAEGGETLKGMLKLRMTAREALAENADAKETFANLGIDPKAFVAQSLTEQILTLADAFAQLSKKGGESAVALQFLDAMGTKNRTVLKLLGSGREAITENFTGTPTINHEHLAELDRQKEEAVAAEFQSRATLADSGVVEGMGVWQRIGQGAKNKLMGATAAVGRQIPHFSNFVRGNWGWEMEDLDEEDRAKLRKMFGGEKPPEMRMRGAVPGGAEATESESHNAAITGTGTTAKPFANATTRGAMDESVREMDFRNSMLLETDLAERAKRLKGEQLRVLGMATGESDPAKAFGLLMKGKGMEPEIIATMRQLQAPDLLQVKSGRGREMGLGGPMSAFGGVEVQIREQTDYLREIRDRLVGAGGGLGFNTATGKVASPTDAAGFGIGGMVRILNAVPNFPKER